MVTGDIKENPQHEFKQPEWLTEQYFEEVLRNNVPNYKKIVRFQTTAAIPPGENYTSLMLRNHFVLEMKDGSTLKKAYVLKTMLDDNKGGRAVKEMSLFPKELLMYRNYLPAFEELYKSAGWNVQLAPKCLKTEVKDGNINFVFEDLAEKKFQNVSRQKGCDFQHMVRSLQKLAEFHAASVIYEEENGPYPDDFHRGFVSEDENHEFQNKIFFTKVNSYKKAIGLWGLKDAEKYIEKFPTYEQYRKCAKRTLKTKGNSFNVLTHCDFWSSNIMQNYLSTGEIDELVIVDYQFCKWGSPAEDLLLFLSVSAAQEIRLKEFEHFVEIYHTHLVKCLKVLKYKKPLPKLRDIHMDMYKENTSFYAFLAVLNHMPMIFMPTDKNCNMEVLLRDDEESDQFRLRAFLNPPFVEAMRELFPFYHRRGVFNFEDYD